MEGSIILVALILIITNLILEKIMLKKNEPKLNQTEGRFTDWTIKIILVIVILISFFIIDFNDDYSLRLFIQLVLIVALGSQAFLEWKYLESSRTFIVTLLVLTLGLFLTQFL